MIADTFVCIAFRSQPKPLTGYSSHRLDISVTTLILSFALENTVAFMLDCSASKMSSWRYGAGCQEISIEHREKTIPNRGMYSQRNILQLYAVRMEHYVRLDAFDT